MMEYVKITNFLKKFVFKYINYENNNGVMYAIINGQLMMLYFSIIQEVEYQNYSIDGSHEKFIAVKINDFIKNNVESKFSQKLNIKYNFDEGFTYEIIITFNHIGDDNFILFDEIISSDIKKNKRIKQKEKLLKLIQQKTDICLTDIVQKTRFIKDKDERKQMLNELVLENKISLYEFKKAKKKKKIYSIVE